MSIHGKNPGIAMDVAAMRIRWVVNRDFDRIVEIHHLTFPNTPPEEAVTADQLIGMLRSRNTIGQVIEDCSGLILGYMLYDLRKHEIEITSIEVHPLYRRFGIGTKLIDKLKSKLSIHRRRSLKVVIFDDNLDAHLFFKACGFKAMLPVKRNYWLTGCDAYEFRYEVASSADGFSEQEIMGDASDK